MKKTETGEYPTHWHGGKADGTDCGGGSTHRALAALPSLFSTWAIIEEELGFAPRIVEIGCGDLRCAKKLLGEYALISNYHGTDIQPRDSWKDELLLKTSVLDCVAGPLPRADVVIARDVFIHFDTPRVLQTLANIRDCGAEYLFATTHHGADNSMRQSSPSEGFAQIDLQAEPFNLQLRFDWPEITEGKYLGLFEI